MPLSDHYPDLKGWTPAPNVSPMALPQLPTPEVQVSPFLRATLPLPLIYTPDTLKQSNRPGLSSYRVAPQSPSSFPAINAAATSSVSAAIAQAVIPISGGGGGISSVGVTGPKEIVTTNSPITPPGGTITWGWASETPGTVFQTPGPGLTGFQTLAQASATSSSAFSFTVSATPTTASAFALFFGISNDTWTLPSGWTSVVTGVEAVWYRSISGTSPVAVANSFAFGGSAIGSLALFNGPAPSFVQTQQAATKSGTVSFTGNNTAGNTLIVSMQTFDFGAGVQYGLSMSDSNGNTYQQIINQQFPIVGANPELQQAVFVATNCKGGANTITFNYSGQAGAGPVYLTQITEFGPLPTGSSIPFFNFLTSSAIPAINLQSSGNGGVAGVLPAVNGGTGKTTLTAHGVLLGEGTSAINATSAGTSGQVLTSNGASADPTFQGAAVQVSSTSLSSAQLLALLGTPVSLIPTPGPGFTILPLSVSIILFGGSAAYTDAGGAVSFNIGSATQALASNAIFTTVTSPNKQIQRVAGFPATDTAGNPPTDDNAAMTISKATNNFAAGNGTAKVIVHYIVMPTT